MTTCGVWPRHRGLVAVLLDDAGHIRSSSIASTDDARSGLACWLAAAGADLVLDEALLRTDPMASLARRSGVTVWIVAEPLVTALRLAAGVAHRGPRPSAAILARLPAIPWLRPHLRQLEGDEHDRQIRLL